MTALKNSGSTRTIAIMFARSQVGSKTVSNYVVESPELRSRRPLSTPGPFENKQKTVAGSTVGRTRRSKRTFAKDEGGAQLV